MSRQSIGEGEKRYRKRSLMESVGNTIAAWRSKICCALQGETGKWHATKKTLSFSRKVESGKDAKLFAIPAAYKKVQRL